MYTESINHFNTLKAIQALLRLNLKDIDPQQVHCISFNFDDNQVPVYFWNSYRTIEGLSIKINQEMYGIDAVQSIDVYGDKAQLLN